MPGVAAVAADVESSFESTMIVRFVPALSTSTFTPLLPIVRLLSLPERSAARTWSRTCLALSRACWAVCAALSGGTGRKVMVSAACAMASGVAIRITASMASSDQSGMRRMITDPRS